MLYRSTKAPTSTGPLRWRPSRRPKIQKFDFGPFELLLVWLYPQALWWFYSTTSRGSRPILNAVHQCSGAYASHSFHFHGLWSRHPCYRSSIRPPRWRESALSAELKAGPHCWGVPDVGKSPPRWVLPHSRQTLGAPGWLPAAVCPFLLPNVAGLLASNRPMAGSAL